MSPATVKLFHSSSEQTPKPAEEAEAAEAEEAEAEEAEAEEAEKPAKPEKPVGKHEIVDMIGKSFDFEKDDFKDADAKTGWFEFCKGGLKKDLEKPAKPEKPAVEPPKPVEKADEEIEKPAKPEKPAVEPPKPVENGEKPQPPVAPVKPEVEPPKPHLHEEPKAEQAETEAPAEAAAEATEAE